MKDYPKIETENLLLRQFLQNDAADVQRLAGNKEIASTTLNIPHPYEDGMSENWINTHQKLFEEKIEVIFALAHRRENFLIGAIGLSDISKEHNTASMGYWIGKEFWGNGYCSEAARAMLGYGFEQMNLGKIYAHHLSRNPASGRVMQKIGMVKEGTLRKHVKKWGVSEDIEFYGILRDEYFRMV